MKLCPRCNRAVAPEQVEMVDPELGWLRATWVECLCGFTRMLEVEGTAGMLAALEREVKA